MSITNCRFFNGYKPCGKNDVCDTQCSSMSVPTLRVLLIHLEALGAVMRSTALLPAIRRKYPGCHITWVTQKPADQLLLHNPLVDRVFTTSSDDLLQLSALEFDIALVIDKGLKAAGVLKQTHADLVYGFQVDSASGAVLPATPAAYELWNIGLSNEKKFFINQKPETRLAHEALELGAYERDEYVLHLNPQEVAEVRKRRAQWLRGEAAVIGLNTGCSGVIPYKKLSIEKHRDLIRELSQGGSRRIVLLGGKEDTLRNQRIAHGLDVVQSPTDRGLRDGIVSVAACDVVVTGDSLGMHLAIALQKQTIAWFGPTCAHEIDLYERGTHVLSQVACGPCWKRSCDHAIMCYDQVSVDELVSGVKAAENRIKFENDQTSEEKLNWRNKERQAKQEPTI